MEEAAMVDKEEAATARAAAEDMEAADIKEDIVKVSDEHCC
jgi:hypothetical protein